MKLVVYGLTITSAWGNGHATTYRSLLKAMRRRGHTAVFIEKDVEWYRSNRDLPEPSFCSVRLYEDWPREEKALLAEAQDADAIIVGSYFPDAKLASQALAGANYGPVLFYDIDTPITISHLRAAGSCEYLDASFIPNYAAYLSFTGGPILHELETRFGSPRAVPFYCSVDPDMYRPTTSDPEYTCDLSYLGTYASDRQPKLQLLLNDTARLLPEQNFLIAGAMYPAEETWATNVRRITHVSPPDHPSFYSSARFTLNLTRHEMVQAGYSPSVRLFEASACGTAILSDSWRGLSEFLTPGEEVLLPQNAEQTAGILRTMSDEERLRIGKRARARILSEHTSVHRAMQLEQVVSECGSTSSAVRQPDPQMSASKVQADMQ